MFDCILADTNSISHHRCHSMRLYYLPITLYNGLPEYQVATLFCDIYSASLMPPLLLWHKKEGDFNQCSVLNVFTMILQLYD